MTAAITAHRRGRLGLVLIAASLALIVLTGLLGPSAAEAALPGRIAGPPFWFSAAPPAWLVTALPDIALGSGAAGLVLAWSALRRGWTPRLRGLIAGSWAAAGAMVVVPPMLSADHLVYAAYGRLVTTGGNPYTETAATLATHGDPVGLAVQPPWTNTSSVYGPLATAEQALASWIGGDSVHTTVFVLALLGAAAFVAMGAMLRRLGDPAQVTVLFGLNPLLLLETVNAAHLDAFAVFFAIAGLYVLHRRQDAVGAALAGALIGLGCAAKLSLGLAVAAGIWGLRRSRRGAGVFVFCAALVGGLTYLSYGLVALQPAREAARMVSLGSAWRPLLAPLQHAVGDGTARDLISAFGWLVLVLLVVLLAPLLRARRAEQALEIAGLSRADVERAASPGVQAAHALALLCIAWVLAAPYTLPWYDIVAWAPLVVCASGPLDLLLIARTTLLAAAYVPGLDVPLPSGVAGWASWIRADAAPVFSIAAVLACVALGIRQWRVPRHSAAVTLPQARSQATKG
ncbi:MAG TPA: polyprenol phosphomannose-dependent alpha 1,6 mannosyltransferase MptB [Actinocrinis sp.]|nr:polyprenol phosphomannose-dependent alpha 1,6 mannosyltransferase MptB [Actinocrinis sp.]